MHSLRHHSPSACPASQRRHSPQPHITTASSSHPTPQTGTMRMVQHSSPHRRTCCRTCHAHHPSRLQTCRPPLPLQRCRILAARLRGRVPWPMACPAWSTCISTASRRQGPNHRQMGTSTVRHSRGAEVQRQALQGRAHLGRRPRVVECLARSGASIVFMSEGGHSMPVALTVQQQRMQVNRERPYACLAGAWFCQSIFIASGSICWAASSAHDGSCATDGSAPNAVLVCKSYHQNDALRHLYPFMQLRTFALG